MRTRPIFFLTLGLALALGAASVAGVIPEVAEHQARGGLHDALSDPETAPAALESVLRKRDALRQLEQVAVEGTDLSARGRAILAIRDLRQPEAEVVLHKLADGSFPPLVRSWAASSLITRAPDLDAYLALAQKYQAQLPAVQRPIELKAATLLADADTAQMLELLSVQPNLASSIAPKIMEAPASELVELMQTHPTDGVRRQAAAYLASKGTQNRQGYAEVADATLEALAHSHELSDYPWAGGALYVPGLQWQRDDARNLVGKLIRWNLHADSKGDDGMRQQVQNNLRSVQLLEAAGFQNKWPDVNGPEVLVEWGRFAGRDKVVRALKSHNLMDSRWAGALDQLGER